MRMQLGSLGASPIFSSTGEQIGTYPYPSPVVLWDGRVIADPANTRAEYSDCVPYQCGVDGQNNAAQMWCSWWSHPGVKTCIDPQCQQYLSMMPHCALPSPAPSQPPAPPIPTLTPENIVAPLPDITRVLAPSPSPVPSCTPWCVINGWIGEHPLLAVAMVAGAAVLLWPKGGR